LQRCRSAASDGLAPSRMPMRDIIKLYAETLVFVEQYRELKRRGRDPRVVMGFGFTQRLYALP